VVTPEATGSRDFMIDAFAHIIPPRFFARIESRWETWRRPPVPVVAA
jgi:hypothetical protein